MDGKSVRFSACLALPASGPRCQFFYPDPNPPSFLASSPPGCGLFSFYFSLSSSPSRRPRRVYVGEGGMPRPSAVTLANARKAFKDLDLRKALQLEISHEHSSPSRKFQNQPAGSLGDFTLTWDSPDSRDISLQKKCQSGEEVVVSALLGPESVDAELPWDVKMKVYIKKPHLSSILQFDCMVPSRSYGGPRFDIYGAHILPLSTSLRLSDYRGPLFSTLDPRLQDGLKEYLAARGIGDSIVNFLLLHMHKKEQNQYVNWLEKLEKMVSRED